MGIEPYFPLTDPAEVAEEIRKVKSYYDWCASIRPWYTLLFARIVCFLRGDHPWEDHRRWPRLPLHSFKRCLRCRTWLVAERTP